MLHILVMLIALPVWLFGLALPMGWLVVAGTWQAVAPAGEPSTLTYAWQLKLYASSLILMVLAGLVAMVLATAAGYAFARIGRLAVVWVSAGALMVPPLVYGYLWFLTLGNLVTLQALPVPFNLPIPNLVNLAVAGGAIGLWLWPIPALILTAGWQWTGRPAWLLARMDTSDTRAFLRAGLPAMRPYLLAAWAVSLLLAAQEYAVPALFSVQTWQTQWLELARSGTPLGQLAIAALPPAVLLIALILLFVRFWRSVESLGPSDLGVAILRPRARLYAWAILLLVIGLAMVVPSAGAIGSLTKPLQFNLQRFQDELVNTPIIMTSAATMALACALLAVPIAARRRFRSSGTASDNGYRFARPRWLRWSSMAAPFDFAQGRHDAAPSAGSGQAMAPGRARPLAIRAWHPAPGRVMLILAVASWALPVSLMAEAGKQGEIAIISLLDRIGQQIPVIGNTLNQPGVYGWLDVLLWVSVLAGRMLPVAWILMALVARSLPAHLVEQAAVDGANRSQILQRILLPLLAPAAVAGWLICGLLIATDTVAAVMLQPAGFQVLAVSLLNQMHYGRDGDIVATCLMTLGAAGLAASIAALTLGRANKNVG